MKGFFFFCLVALTFIFPDDVWSGDTTLLFTVKTEVDHVLLKKDLRIGLWKEGKDGVDPMDTQALLNGLFDAYFDNPIENIPPLWWDIRSLKPVQEWNLIIKAPEGEKVVLEWKQVPFAAGINQTSFNLIDSDTGQETPVDGTGAIEYSSPRSLKKFLIKSVQKF